MREWFNKAGAPYRPVKASVALKPATQDGGEDNGPARLAPVQRPFPENPFFRSQPVLGEETRELVWEKVVLNGESIKAVAAELSIDMRRVAAVVRLKQVEKSWISEGKPLAKPYAQAVLAMLPQTNYGPREAVQPHEPISEIHAHSYAAQQLFVPVSESRHFTREDAAAAFHTTLLPADRRVPIPELITLERDVLAGNRSPEDSFRNFRTQAAAEHKALVERDRAAAATEHRRTTRAETDRFTFRIRNINAETVGKTGRSPKAVGWRYGVPFHDRKRGQIKIPTSVG